MLMLMLKPPRTYRTFPTTAAPPGRMVPAALPGQLSEGSVVRVSVIGSYVFTTAVAVVAPAAEPPTRTITFEPPMFRMPPTMLLTWLSGKAEALTVQVLVPGLYGLHTWAETADGNAATTTSDSATVTSTSLRITHLLETSKRTPPAPRPDHLEMGFESSLVREDPAMQALERAGADSVSGVGRKIGSALKNEGPSRRTAPLPALPCHAVPWLTKPDHAPP